MPRKQTPRLSVALVEYETIRRSHVTKSTLDNDHSVLTRFIRGVGDPQAHLLTARVVELYFAQESDRQMASSFNKVRTRVGLFMKFLQRRGWVDADPLGEVRTRRVVPRERLRLSVQELRHVIEGAQRPRDRAFLAVAINTALRKSDVCSIRLRDVDLDAGVIHIVTQKTKLPDALPITQDLDVELRRWLRIYSGYIAEQQEMFPDRVHHLGPDSYLLPPYWAEGYTGARWVSPDRPIKHAERIVQAALLRIGYTEIKGEGIHLLRRSTARHLFETASAEGHDSALRITAALLGHKSVTTTEGYIGVSLDRQKRDALLKGRSFLNPTPPPAGKVVPIRRTS